MALKYPNGEVIHAGDRILVEGEPARVLFVKQSGEPDEFAVGIAASDWSFMPTGTVFLHFENGQQMGYSSFCDHDEVVLLSRE